MVALVAIGGASCSSSPNLSLYTASGYVADQGINRLWRLDNTLGSPQTLINVYSPYHDKNTVITRYEYQNNVLSLIKETHLAAEGETVQLRFDSQGNVSFMQRQRATQRERLSGDDIERYKYQASSVLDISNQLRAGKVKLIQGRWVQGVITSCAKELQQPEFSAQAQIWLAKRAGNSNDHLGLAWLVAPKGTQLLLVANEDFCTWEPKESDM